MRYISREFFSGLRKGLVRPNDILLVKDGATIGKVALVRTLPYEECAVNEHVFILRAAPNYLPGFLYEVIRSPGTQEAIWKEVTGSAQPGLNSSFIKYVSVCLPSLPEQKAIALFLDWADQRIRWATRARQKRIRLLAEYNQGLVRRVVTGQFDVRNGQPYPDYKPSGVEWLGDVPKHWVVRPAKYFYREVDDRSTTGREDLLTVSHITGVTPRSQKTVTMFKAASYAGHKVCKPGDLIVNTMWAWMGALGVATQQGIVSPSYGVYRPHLNSPLLGDYADSLLRTRPYIDEYVCRSTGIRSSRLRLYPDQFLRIRVICPPSDEQRAILAYLSSHEGTSKRVFVATRNTLELLKEFRTRLIADVVTGKLDVRDLEGPSLVESEASDILDPMEEGEAIGPDQATEGDDSDER